ncbi:hypothetical protein ACFL4T_13450 [candidate division KSB1 bacterium]
MTGIMNEPVIKSNLIRHSNLQTFISHQNDLFHNSGFQHEKVLNSFILGERYNPSLNVNLVLRTKISGHFGKISRYNYRILSTDKMINEVQGGTDTQKVEF